MNEEKREPAPGSADAQDASENSREEQERDTAQTARDDDEIGVDKEAD